MGRSRTRKTIDKATVGQEITFDEPGFIRLPDGSVTGCGRTFVPRAEGEHVRVVGDSEQTFEVSKAEG